MQKRCAVNEFYGGRQANVVAALITEHVCGAEGQEGAKALAAGTDQMPPNSRYHGDI